MLSSIISKLNKENKKRREEILKGNKKIKITYNNWYAGYLPPPYWGSSGE